MDEVIIQKRLSNWADHLLKRLQVLYDRGDFCDLILQFHTNQILKVHRVVVNLCTDYFANLERTYGLQNGMLVLPKDIEYSSVVTIVKFFYTGKLEVKGSQFNDTYRTVKLMNILILTKLLEAHARNPITTAKKEPAKPIIFKQAIELGKSQLQKIPAGAIIQEGTTINLSSNMTTKNITTRPMNLPGMKTKTVLARVQSQPSVVRVATNHHQGKLLTNQQKKLPIWKERKFAPQSLSDPLMLEKWPPRDEPPRPTRFEWPDDTDDADPYLTPATHKLMEKQKANSTHQPQRKAEDIFDAVKSQNQGIKRSISTASSSTITSSDSSIQMDLNDSPASKIAKMNDQSTTSEEESMIVVSMSSSDLTDTSMSDVNLTEETIEEEVSTSEGFSQDMIESSTTMSEDVANSSSVMYSEEESCSSEISISSTPSSSKNTDTISIIMSPPTPSSSTFNKRSSIKSGIGGMTSSSTEFKKTVRFAPELEKENNTNKSSTIQVSSLPNIMIPKNVESPSTSNHSKIISEVLKKYPDLVKDHKNIKLKIVHKETQIPSSASSSSPSKDSKSKVSYIVLKSTSSPDSAGTVVLKKPVMNKAFWESDRTRKLPSGAENTTGPWMCGTSPCAIEDNPIQFETYYSYRRHLVDVHKERIDARICEYCGYKASKRNLLLYHLYTKHGINPPMNCSFPHCEKCDYIALSESLLIKHKQGHDANKEFSCTICNASFKSSGALQGHMVANLHRNKDTKVYECPYCRKPFVRNINLKAHIRSLHKDVARSEEMEDPRLLSDDETIMTNNRTVTLVDEPGGLKKRQFPSILGSTRTIIGNTSTEHSEEMGGQNMEGLVRSLVTADGQTIEILHHGIDPMSVPVQLVPSSEAEALTNVATSIAASLGLDHGQVGTEFVNSDGSPAVFIMDNSQNAVEVGVNVGMADHGSMIFEGGDATGGSEQFIVQDMQGNHFRKIEAIDETGKQVIFFQLQSENGQMTMAPGIQLDDSIARFDDGHGEGGAHFNFESGQAHFPNECSVFVNTTSLPVTVSSDGVMSLANAGGSGSVIELVSAAPVDGQHNTIVTTESLMGQVGQHCSVVSSDHQHLIQTSQGQVPVTVDHMGQLQVIQEVIQDVQVQVGQVLHSNNNKSESGEIIIEQIDDMSHQQQEQHQQQQQEQHDRVLQNQQEQHEGELETQHQEQERNENPEQEVVEQQEVQEQHVQEQQHEEEQHYQNESYNIQQEEEQVIQEDSCTHETHVLEGGSDHIMKPDQETQITQSETTEIPTTPIEHERESHVVSHEEPQNETQIIQDETEIVQNVDDQVIHEKNGESEIIQHQVTEKETSGMEVQKMDEEQKTEGQENKQEPEQTEQEMEQNETNVSDESQMIVEGQDTGNEQVLLEEEECMQVDEATTENIEIQTEKESVVGEKNTTEYVQSEIIQEKSDERTEMENEEREVQPINSHEHIEEEQVQHNGTISSDSDHISSLVLEQVKEQENGVVDSVNDNDTKSDAENSNFQQLSEQNVNIVENSESVLYAQVELVRDQQQVPLQQQRQEAGAAAGNVEEEEESIERIEAEVQRDLNQTTTEADTQELMVCVEDATVDV